jgi:hypothetical protein
MYSNYPQHVNKGSTFGDHKILLDEILQRGLEI